MIQFVVGNTDQATEPMLFNSAEIISKLDVHIHRSNTNTNTPIWYFFK